MTNTYLTNITPDGISGLIFAFEGIKNAATLLNGPTGCKFYHSATSDNQLLRKGDFDPLHYPELWYFGQSRVPCTFLDKRDYVYGSEDKLREAILFIEEEVKPDILFIVNTPGAALIGDDLERISRETDADLPIITVETPGYSIDMREGFHLAYRKVFDFVLDKVTTRQGIIKNKRKRVNLLGLTLFHKYCQGDAEEMKRMLSLMGVDVCCMLGLNSSLAEIKSMPEADLNIVVDPNYGKKAAIYLKEKYGTPFIDIGMLPIGFKASETLISLVAKELELDFKAVMEDSERIRAACYVHLQRINSLTGLPKGTCFAVSGWATQVLGYTKFLIEYLGMVAETVNIVGEADYDIILKIEELLRENDMSKALERNIDESEAEIVLADGNIIGRLKAMGKNFSGIETALPSLGYVDIVPKTHLGNKGAMLLIEQILNGLRY